MILKKKKIIREKNRNDKIVLSFAGSVHDNHCWEILFDGISKLNKSYVDLFEIRYYGGYIEKIDKKINNYNLPNNIIKNYDYLKKMI